MPTSKEKTVKAQSQICHSNSKNVTLWSQFTVKNHCMLHITLKFSTIIPNIKSPPQKTKKCNSPDITGMDGQTDQYRASKWQSPQNV